MLDVGDVGMIIGVALLPGIVVARMVMGKGFGGHLGAHKEKPRLDNDPKNSLGRRKDDDVGGEG